MNNYSFILIRKLQVKELSLATQFGSSIERGLSDSNTDSPLNFRKKYLIRLQNIANDKLIVTNKMPRTFPYIGLLAVTFSEAKIVHVKRKPTAVCRVNYKQNLTSKAFGYCFRLDDTISYDRLYANLMEFWR